MKNKTLLVGCGGSGITTLIRMNEMLAGNPEMRQRIREDVSYLVIDTEEDKVSTFEESIARQMGGAGLPAMRLVQMTSGFVDLHEIVEPNLDEQRDEELLALLKRHWWCAPDGRGTAGKGRAFRAISVTPITDGAGQCAPVAFLSAWNYLPKLEEDVTGLLEEIQQRNTDVENPLANLRVYIVTGLAGGTGRGCWNLVAFKIRQSLMRFGVRTDPVGVFFDATCFQSRWAGSPGEAKSMRMNALTGVSELSAWMRLVKAPEDAYRYAIPDLSRPDPKGRTDVIKVPKTGDKERSPVAASYLVFGNNGAGRLKDNHQYHEMAAAALYSLVASDTFIGAKTVNLPENVRSFAATTFEVETVGIRRYMEALVHLDYGLRLCRQLPETDKEALKLTGNWLSIPPKDTFFEKTGLYVSSKVSEEDLGGTTGGVLTRLMLRASEVLGFDEKTGQFETWKAIEAKLKAQNAVAAKDKARKALVDVDDREDDILEVCTEKLERSTPAIGKATLGRTLQGVIREAFYSEGKEDPSIPGIKTGGLPPSVARARAVAAVLKTAFEASVVNVAGTEDDPLEVYIDIAQSGFSDAEACYKKFAERIDAMSDRKASDFFKKFSENEISLLGEEFKKYQRVALFFHIQKLLKELFVRAAKIVSVLDGVLETLELGLGDVSAEFRTKLCMDFDAATPSEVFDSLFTRDDDDSIFQSLQESDSYTNMFRRILKPITTPEALSALIADPALNETPIVDQLKKELDNLFGDTAGKVYKSNEDARFAIRKAFTSLVRDNVGLPCVNGKDFMSANFPLLKVLADNREKWNRLLAHRWNSEDARGKVLDLFRTYLGVEEQDLERNPDEGSNSTAGRIPDAKTLLRHIVVSMISPCRPWMQLEGGASMQYLSTIALIPTGLSSAETEQYDKDIKKKFGDRRPVNLHHRDEPDGKRLPEDRIVLFSATGIIPPKNGDRNPFNYIGSLRYWHDAELTELLEDAEKQSGEGYFEYLEDEPGRGYWAELDRTYGFVSPIFLTNPDLANRRWRPWKPVAEDLQEEDERMKQAMTALLQGLLGTGVSSDLLAKVEAKGWIGFPLLAKTGKGVGAESLVFQRNCLTDALAWSERFVLGTTLKNAFEFLMGRGRPNETREIELAEQSRSGTRMRKALLAEKEKFDNEVLSALAEEDRKAIRDALKKYLEEQARENRIDPELWEELYRMWDSKAES